MVFGGLALYVQLFYPSHSLLIAIDADQVILGIVLGAVLGAYSTFLLSLLRFISCALRHYLFRIDESITPKRVH
jgi:hypothetical protein